MKLRTRFIPVAGCARYGVSGLLGLLGLLSLVGCASDPEALFPIPEPIARALPESLPVPEPAPVPEPPPTPVPPPEPVGHAPLVGTRWTLTRLYGDMRRLEPSSRDIWVEFRWSPAEGTTGGVDLSELSGGEGVLHVQGSQNTMDGRYEFRVNLDSPRESLTFEEGRVAGSSLVHNRRAGSHSELEAMLLENLQILKGYYIEGETPEESRLTIWGGYRSEEVILMELEASIPEDGM